MYFPAGIPLIALVALVIYNAQQEKKRMQAPAKPSSGAAPKQNARF